MSERPRDRLGRPLATDADPTTVVPGVPDVSGLNDDAIWLLALDYLAQDLPFHAHETFEQRWRTCDPADRQAWKALAQWGAAMTHAARGNREGADRLARRAADTLAEASSIPPSIDVAQVLASCARVTRPISR